MTHRSPPVPFPPTRARRRAGKGAGFTATLAIALASAALLGACGGGGDSDFMPAALTVELDADRLTVEQAARDAADARGAPGESEAVAYTVVARSHGDAQRLANALKARGFGPVRVWAR